MVTLLLSPLTLANDIVVIGNSSEGTEVIYKTSAKNIERSLLDANILKRELAQEVLANHTFQSSWKLNQFTLGLGVEGEAGIGPWNLGLAIKQRLVFKK
jgi:hypothetical protein